MISLLQTSCHDWREIDDRVLCATSARLLCFDERYLLSLRISLGSASAKSNHSTVACFASKSLAAASRACLRCICPWGNFNWRNWRIFNWRKVGNFQLALTNDDYGVAVAEAFAAAVLARRRGAEVANCGQTPSHSLKASPATKYAHRVPGEAPSFGALSQRWTARRSSAAENVGQSWQ
jgi:hypothetical protein